MAYLVGGTQMQTAMQGRLADLQAEWQLGRETANTAALAHSQTNVGEATMLIELQGNYFRGRGMGLSPDIPMPLRRQITAQSGYRANEALRDDGQPHTGSIRIMSLMSVILGVPLSLAYRVTRAVLRTVFLPITSLYAHYQGSRYGVDGMAREDLTRIGEEWVDVFANIYAIFSGLVNMIHPNAINHDRVAEYYHNRMERISQKREELAQAKTAFQTARREALRSNGNARAAVN